MTAFLKGTKRDLQVFLYGMERQGWNISRTNGGHIKIKHPDYGFVICSSTASDGRSLDNLRRDIRRRIGMFGKG